MKRTSPTGTRDGGSAPDASALCTNCGLCCDGLFAKLRITPDERALAERAAGPVLEREDGIYASLPCSYLHGTICTVYAARYAACRKFTCKLLRGYVGGSIDGPAAATRIAEMRRRLDIVRAAAATAGHALPDREFRGKAAGWQEAEPADRRGWAAAHLAIMAFDRHADRHFRNAPEPPEAGLRTAENDRATA